MSKASNCWTGFNNASWGKSTRAYIHDIYSNLSSKNFNKIIHCTMEFARKSRCAKDRTETSTASGDTQGIELNKCAQLKNRPCSDDEEYDSKDEHEENWYYLRWVYTIFSSIAMLKSTLFLVDLISLSESPLDSTPAFFTYTLPLLSPSFFYLVCQCPKKYSFFLSISLIYLCDIRLLTHLSWLMGFDTYLFNLLTWLIWLSHHYTWLLFPLKCLLNLT